VRRGQSFSLCRCKLVSPRKEGACGRRPRCLYSIGPSLRLFRTTLNGPAIFYIDDHFYVARIGPYEGAIAQSTSLWPADGIPTVEVTADVAEWLEALP
jgi:hypothetical protein